MFDATITRGRSLDLTPPAFDEQRYRIASAHIVVPSHRTVSEANTYYPFADIVWRGDPVGNRREQVRDIFKAAVLANTMEDSGRSPVHANIEVARFHSLTEKARYTTGGDHHMVFFLSLRDVETGEAIADRKEMRTNLDAYGGGRAIAADAAGQTMKVRIIDFLTKVIAQELRVPEETASGDRDERVSFYTSDQNSDDIQVTQTAGLDLNPTFDKECIGPEYSDTQQLEVRSTLCGAGLTLGRR
ncbi:MAG: DUF6778 family protein [Pseudomonadota bacterium]